jgi:hypothetical protein
MKEINRQIITQIQKAEGWGLLEEAGEEILLCFEALYKDEKAQEEAHTVLFFKLLTLKVSECKELLPEFYR